MGYRENLNSLAEDIDCFLWENKRELHGYLLENIKGFSNRIKIVAKSIGKIEDMVNKAHKVVFEEKGE